MGNCCGATTVPFSPEPQDIELTTPAPVISQPSTELSPVPSSQPLPRARSRTRSMPEPRHRSRMSSQDLIRMEPVPQSSKSPPPPLPSSQTYRTRTKSLAALKRSNRSSCRPTSPSRAIDASIEYVCLSPDSYLVYLVLRNGRSRAYADLTDSTIPKLFCFRILA
jgi:hypothetical protein